MIRLSPTGETSVKAKAKCISRPHCVLAAPSPTAEATRDANCLRWREKMQIYTPSLLKCKLPLLEVAVDARREGVARGVRQWDERRRPPRPRPHRAALAPDPLQLHRLLPPRLLLVLGALAGHVDGHLIRGLLLRGHLAGAARPRPRELLAGVEVAQGGRASPARAECGRA